VKREKTTEGQRLDWILQILSRLTQADRPHEDLTSARTIQCLFKLLSRDKQSLGRVSRILTRLSSNLYCLFPILKQKHATWIQLQLQQKGGLECCEEHDSEVRKVARDVINNLTQIAETGYGEGEICHRLVNPAFEADKQNIAISATLLVKERRKLANILINHDSLEILLDILERETGDLMRDSVHSLSVVAGHLGIVSPNLTIVDTQTTTCNRSKAGHTDDLTLVLDDGSELTANRDLVSTASPVFQAMLEGGFKEASRSRVEIPLTSRAALNCIIHNLYSCSWCAEFEELSVTETLELLALSDKFLLQELNVRVSHQIIKGCMQEAFLLSIYRNSLQKEMPVRCVESSLSKCAVSTILVADMTTETRTKLIQTLMESDLRSDFLDDVNQMLRKCLMKQ